MTEGRPEELDGMQEAGTCTVVQLLVFGGWPAYAQRRVARLWLGRGMVTPPKKKQARPAASLSFNS